MSFSVNEINSPIIGYKRLLNSKYCSLEIDPLSSDLHRPGVFDKNHAMFKCHTATVLSIYRKDEIGGIITNVPQASGQSIRDPNFTYNVGDTIHIDNCDIHDGKTHSPGIHFFLTEETAFSFMNIHSKNSWYSDGHPKFSYHFDSEKNCSTSSSFYKDGSIKEIVNYKGDYNHVALICEKHLNRPYIQREGERHGIYIIKYPNGCDKTITRYQHGLRDGSCNKFYSNGRLSHRSFYKNGIRDGPAHDFYPGGQVKIVKTYCGGNLNRCYTKFLPDGTKIYERYFLHGAERGCKFFYNTGIVSETIEILGPHNFIRRRFNSDGTLKYEKKV